VKGSKNRRTKEVEEALRPLVPSAKRKLKALIESSDDKTAFMAVMGVLGYVYGKPVDRREIGGPGGEPLIPQLSNQEAALRIANILGEVMRKKAAGEITNSRGRVGGQEISHAAPALVLNNSSIPDSDLFEIEANSIEPEIGEIAYVGGFIVECVEGTRSGLPPSYRILNEEQLLLTHAVAGWEGALSWIRTKVGENADMAVRIEKPSQRLLIDAEHQPDQRLPAERLPKVQRRRQRT
jgi:hypothetical protein